MSLKLLAAIESFTSAAAWTGALSEEMWVGRVLQAISWSGTRARWSTACPKLPKLHKYILHYITSVNTEVNIYYIRYRYLSICTHRLQTTKPNHKNNGSRVRTHPGRQECRMWRWPPLISSLAGGCRTDGSAHLRPPLALGGEKVSNFDHDIRRICSRFSPKVKSMPVDTTSKTFYEKLFMVSIVKGISFHCLIMDEPGSGSAFRSSLHADPDPYLYFRLDPAAAQTDGIWKTLVISTYHCKKATSESFRFRHRQRV
jgi:hypothetical protein